MRRRASAIAILTVGGLTSFAGSAAADSGSGGRTFTDVVAQARVVVLGQVTLTPDEGLRIQVQQVLKGDAPADLTFDPPTMAPELTTGGQAIIAFTDIRTIDFRAPTTAWTIGAHGDVDPDHLQPYPGLPPTLAGVLAYFGAPATQEPVAAEPAAAEPSSTVPWAVLFVVVVGIGMSSALALARRLSR